jgi:hypothetical protein
MMSRPLTDTGAMSGVDVVVVSYQSGGILLSALEQARKFCPGARLVVVNNDPADELARQAARAAGAQLLEAGWNEGFAAAVNRAIAQTSQEMLLLLNPDISSVSGSWADIARIFDSDPRAGAVGVRLVGVDGSVQDSCRSEPQLFDFLAETLALSRRFPWWSRPRRYRMLDWSYDEERVVDAASGAFLALRRATVRDVGLFDERFFVYSEELDWLVRAKGRGWRTYFTPEVTAMHKGGGSSEESSQALALLLLASWHSYARKHFGLIRSLALRSTLAVIEVVRIARTAAHLRSLRHNPEMWERLLLHVGRRPSPPSVKT